MSSNMAKRKEPSEQTKLSAQVLRFVMSVQYSNNQAKILLQALIKAKTKNESSH
jgi:hypothetical protein